MQRLHPTLLKKFMVGEYVVHHQNGLWNAIWSDLFIETTCMQYGQGPLDSTMNESTLTFLMLSHSTCAQLMNVLEAMKDAYKERHTCIKANATDRMKILGAVSTCIKVLQSDKYPINGLVDLFSGIFVDDAAVNGHNSVEIGTSQWLDC